MDKDQELILQAYRIVTGESIALMANDMGKAGFKERTDSLAALQGATEALVDAYVFINRGFTTEGERKSIEAALATATEQLDDLRWLDQIDSEWERKVLK